MRKKPFIMPFIVACTFILASCGLIDTIKEKIPLGGEGGEAAKETPDKKADKKPDKKADKKPDKKPEEKKPDPEPAEGPGPEPAEEPAGEEEVEEPAGDPVVKSDIPASIKTKTKIKKVLVVGHKDELKKYGPAARKATPAIRECHRSALVDKPKAVGKIKFKVFISPEGKATRVEVGKNKTGSDDLAACCVEAFKAHSWPKNPDGETRSLSIPIIFEIP